MITTAETTNAVAATATAAILLKGFPLNLQIANTIPMPTTEQDRDIQTLFHNHTSSLIQFIVSVILSIPHFSALLGNPKIVFPIFSYRIFFATSLIFLYIIPYFGKIFNTKRPMNYRFLTT